VGVERRPVHRGIARAARPGGMAAAVTEAGLIPDEDLAWTKSVAVGYLAPSAADMPIFVIFLSGHVSCVFLRQSFETRRYGQTGAPPMDGRLSGSRPETNRYGCGRMTTTGEVVLAVRRAMSSAWAWREAARSS
jgi:hypothetical protein